MTPAPQQVTGTGRPPMVLALFVGTVCVLTLFAILILSLLLQKPASPPVFDVSLATTPTTQTLKSETEPVETPSVPPPLDLSPPAPELDTPAPPPPDLQNPVVYFEQERPPLDIRIPKAPAPPPKIKPRAKPVPRPRPKKIQRPLLKPPTPTPTRPHPKVAERPRPKPRPRPAPPAPQVYSSNQLDGIPRPKGEITGTTFPRSLSRKGIKRGRATLLVEIDTRGRARVLAINSISHPELKPMAIQSVRRARFTVPTKNGRPVRARFQWTLTLQQ